MFDDAVKKVVEDVIAKSNFAMDHMLEDLIETTHDALNETLRDKDEALKLSIIRDALPIIKTLSRAVQRVKE